MPEATKTVVIVSNKRSGEQAIINEVDYDPEKHMLWEDYVTTRAAKKAEKAAEAAAEEDSRQQPAEAAAEQDATGRAAKQGVIPQPSQSTTANPAPVSGASGTNERAKK